MTRLWLALSLCAATTSLASAQPVAGSILFMTPQEWQRATSAEKMALAADFMRIFCAQTTMPPVRLADCLDRAAAGNSLFDSALSCVRYVNELP